MAAVILLSTVSGNLLHDGTKPLHEQLLTFILWNLNWDTIVFQENAFQNHMP